MHPHAHTARAKDAACRQGLRDQPFLRHGNLPPPCSLPCSLERHITPGTKAWGFRLLRPTRTPRGHSTALRPSKLPPKACHSLQEWGRPMAAFRQVSSVPVSTLGAVQWLTNTACPLLRPGSLSSLLTDGQCPRVTRLTSSSPRAT